MIVSAERVSKSFFFGILAAVLLLKLVFAVDGGFDSDVPIEARTPFVWVIMWPKLIWDHLLAEEAAFIATLLTQVFIFSAALHVAFSKRESPNRLP